MTPELKSLCDRLEAWAPLVGSGYDVPAAAETILEAAAKLREMAGALSGLIEFAQGYRDAGGITFNDARDCELAISRARAALGGSHG